MLIVYVNDNIVDIEKPDGTCSEGEFEKWRATRASVRGVAGVLAWVAY